MTRRPAFAGLLALALAAACGSDGGGVAGVLVVASVDVSPGITDVVIGTTKQLAAAPKTATGLPVPGRSTNWSTTDPLIATVSPSGVVTGVALGGPVRIRATVDGVVGDALVTVKPVPIDRITVSPANRGVLVGEGVQFSASAFDAANNPLTGRSFQWESNNSLIAPVTTSGLVIGLAQGGPVTISASAEGKIGTATVSVATRPATRLGFLTQPGAAIAGQAMLPPLMIALQDNLLTTVIGASNQVTIVLAGNPGGATLSGNTIGDPVNGVVTFDNLSLNRVGSGYSFLVTSPDLTPATSIAFSVAAGPAAALTFTTPPSSSASSGAPFLVQPVLQLRDGSGNPVAQAGLLITATIASGPAGGALANATATTNAAGVAGFATLTLSGAAGSYTLSFGGTGLTPLVSGTVSIGAGGAASLAMVTQPSGTAQSGVPLAQQPSVQLRDGAGNPVSRAGVVVTATIATGTGLLGGAVTANTNASGVAQFASLAVNGAAGSYTLGFNAPGLQGATSTPIVLGAGLATQLAITTQPSATATSSVPLSTQPVVQLRDGSNNPVGAAGIQITATITGGGTLIGTATVATNGAGSAVFSGLGLQGLTGVYTLTFTSPGLTPTAPSTDITVSAGAATRLTFTQQPSISAASGIAFAQQPVLQVRDAAGNPVSQVVGVTATITGSPAGVSLVGTVTVSSNASGVATFGNLGLSGTAGSYTLTFTAGALTSPASNSVALSAGGASQITYNQQPSSSASSGQAFAQQPILLLRDASNNPISGVVITATITGTPAGVTRIGTVTATTNASGIATFVGSGLGLSGPVGNYTLTFTAGAVTSSASNAIALGSGTATQLTYTQQPSAAATSGTAFAQQPILLLRDAANNPKAGVVITATITGAPAGVTRIGTVTATTSAAGLATFVGTGLGLLGTAGNYTLTFTGASLSSAASNTIALAAGAASQLTINTQPSASASSGVAFAQQPVILVRDASNNPVSGVVVTATITGAPAGVTRIGTVTATSSASGLASFAGSGLGLSGPSGNYSLTFTAGALSSAASSSIALAAGGASQLTYNTQPSTSANSGQAFATQPALLLRDASNNPVNGALITATITGSPAGVSLVGTATATTNGSGVATFSGLGLQGPVGNYTLTFTAGAVSSAASNSIALAAGTATQLTFSVQPSTSATSGVALGTQPALLLRDAANNPVSGTLITASITGSPAGVSFVGTTTATTNASGIATFTGLGLSGPSGNYTLTFTGASLTSASSNSIALSAGAGTQLTYNTQPSTTANSGAAFATQPALLLRDASSNPVAGALITATVTGSPAGVSFVGSATATTNGSGVATFVGLGLSGPVGSYTLTFTSGSATSVASNSILLSAGTATQITYSQQPSVSAASGAAFTQQPILTIRDAAGNPVLTAGTTVTATITGAPAGVSFVGTTTAATNTSGVASFSNLGLSGTTGNYTLTFTASAPGAITSPASNSIALSAGGANQLTYNTQPSTTANSGEAFATQPVLILRDASNNAISGALVTATITGSPAGVSFVGTASATTNGSGRANFSGLGLSGPVGSYTLTFTAGAVSSSASNSIALSAGTATQLTYSVQPSTSANSSVAFATQPVLLVRDAANNPKPGVVVTATITGAPVGVSFVGTATATTNASGLASFSGLGLQGPVGNYTLTFTGASLTSAASNTIALAAGPATQLNYNTQPSTSATSGAAFATQPVLVLLDGANNPVGSALVTATITGAPAGVSLVGTATATTNASGVATFSGLGLQGPAGDYTLTFTSGAATSPASNSIALSAGTATQLTFQTQPSTSASSTVALTTQPVLLVRDAGNNPIVGTLVTASITGSPAGVSFVGTTTATTDASGLATFSGLGLQGPVGNYTLTFTAGVLNSGASNSIALGAGPATQLAYSAQPSTAVASGATFAAQPVLLLRDGADNPVSGSLITATITGSPAGASLVGTGTATTNGSGLATFTGLGLNALVGNYTLTFTAGAVTSVASNTIGVTTGAATQLTYNQQPSATATSGATFGTQPALLLRDSGNNPVAGTVVTATITGAPAGASLVGSTTATTNAAGVATWTDLGLSALVGNYSLTFTAGAVSSAASNAIAVSAGAATQLTYDTQPSPTASSGAAFATPPALMLRDGANNPVGSAVITATITGAPAGVSLVGTPTASTNGSGVATFSGLGLQGPAGNYTLTFNAGAVFSAASNAIALGSGSATQLAYNTQPAANATNDVALTTQPVILVQDAGNNPVESVVVTATITGAPAGVVLIGTTTASSNASGLATFSGLGLRGLAGNYTLTFTANAGGISSPASGSVALAAGAAAIITANSATSQSATINTAVAASPSVKVTDTGLNPIQSVAVTFAVTAGGGTIVPADPATVSTDASGIATATSWTLGPGAGTNNNTATATAAGLSGSPVGFTASGTAGSATQLTYDTQPPASAANDVAFTTQPVILVRDAGNNPVDNVVVTATITGAPAGVTLIGTATASSNGSGLATFSGLGLRGLAASYTLTFTANAGALSGAASDPVALTAGAAAILTANSATTQSATVGTGVAAPPSVKVTDTGLNPISGVAVTFAVTAGGGTIVPADPATLSTDGTGVATATSWTVGNSAGSNNNTATATSAGLSGSPVTFTASATPATGSQLTIETEPSILATSGNAFATQPALKLLDPFNNPVEGATITATITSSPAGVSFVGTVTAVTNASGIGTFVGLGLTGTPGIYTLTFTTNAGALSSPASNPITLAP